MRIVTAFLLLAYCFMDGLVLQLNSSAARQVSDQAASQSGEASHLRAFSPDDLLIKAYLLGRQLPAEERAFQLLRLTDVSKRHEPALAKLWCQEVLEVSRSLAPNPNAAYLQRNALIDLAAVDPKRALELLRSTDPPVADKSGIIKADPPTGSAEAIFAELWNRGGGAPTVNALQAEAQYLGDTGAYPYAAMGTLMKALHGNAPLVQRLFTEAAGYYQRGSRVASADEDFAEFIKSVGRLVSKSQLKEALEPLVSNLLKPSDPGNSPTLSLQVYTDKGVASFHNVIALLPTIAEVDPDWADRLRRNDPQLAQAGGGSGKVNYIEGAAVHGSADVQQPAAIVEQGMQRSRLVQIREVSQQDPDVALKLSMSLADPALRSVGLATVAAAVAPRDATRASALMNEVNGTYKNISDPADREQVLAALAEAQAAIGDISSFRATEDHAFALGEELLQEELDTHPGKPAFFSNVLQELSRLTKVGCRIDCKNTVTRVVSVRSDVLASYLLIDAAEGAYDNPTGLR